MNGKAALEKPMNLYKEILDIQDRIGDLRAKCEMSGFNLSGDRVKTSLPDGAPFTAYIEQIAELEAKVMRLNLERSFVIAQILHTFKQMNHLEFECILKWVYLDGNLIGDYANNHGHNYNWGYYKLQCAIAHFNRFWNRS